MTRPTRADPAGRSPAGRRRRPADSRSPGSGESTATGASPGPPASSAATGLRYADDQPLAASWDPRPAEPPRRKGTLARAVATYGWRVYALPILVVLTALAVFDVATSPGDTDQADIAGFDDTPGPAQDPGPVPLIPNPVGGPGFEAAKASAELPAGGPFTARGAGTWRVVPGVVPQFGEGQLFTYTVEIEDGVVLEGGPEGFATTVDNTLNNPKSWIGSKRYRFQRIDDGAAADLRVSLTSQETTRAICGFRIPFDASCWRGDQQRVVINNARWARGAVAFQGNVVQYQQYVINHEVGHGLGFSHTACQGNGQLAPVMMQQTWGLDNNYLTALGTDRVTADGLRCEPNAWPFPTVN